MGPSKLKRQKELEKKRAIRQNKEVRASFKYLITLAYDGSRYGGYAKQKHKNTVQNTLEATLKQYFKEDISTTESSRTDAKVHALSQKVMFECHERVAPNKLQSQLNEILPNDIIIMNLEQIKPEFHCRYDVKDKTYEYTIQTAIDPRTNDYSWLVEQKLDINKMIEASRCLIGKHDFATFKAAKATTETSVRTIHYLNITEENGKVIIRINGDGFLYKMVRLVVKALVDVGSHKKDVTYIKHLLDLKMKPDNLESAPAQGLCLMEINY